MPDDLSEWANPHCVVCNGTGQVPWAPGRMRIIADSSAAICPDCIEGVWV